MYHTEEMNGEMKMEKKQKGQKFKPTHFIGYSSFKHNVTSAEWNKREDKR